MDGLRSSVRLSASVKVCKNITKLTMSFFSFSKSSLMFLTTALKSLAVSSLGVKVGSLSINLSIVLVVSGMLLLITTFCSTLFSLKPDLNQDCFFDPLANPGHFTKREQKRHVPYRDWINLAGGSIERLSIT